MPFCIPMSWYQTKWRFIRTCLVLRDVSSLSVSSAVCGVTWTENHRNSPENEFASCSTSVLKTLWGVGPRLKWFTTAWITWGSVLGCPCLATSSQIFLTIFCLKKDKISISSSVIGPGWLVTMLQREGKPQVMWSRDTPGGGMQAKASKIVILCYFLSNCCKIIQNIKNYLWGHRPWWGRSVTHLTQLLEPPLARCHFVHRSNKYGGSRPRGQSLLRYQPVCL